MCPQSLWKVSISKSFIGWLPDSLKTLIGFRNLFGNNHFCYVGAANGTQKTHFYSLIIFILCSLKRSTWGTWKGVCFGSLPCGVMIWAGLAGARTFHVVSVPSEWLHTNCFPSWCQATEWIAYRPNKRWVINHKRNQVRQTTVHVLWQLIWVNNNKHNKQTYQFRSS